MNKIRLTTSNMNIALVYPLIVKNDAVSNTVRDKYLAIKKSFGDYVNIKSYSYRNDYEWPEAVKVRRPVDLIYQDIRAHNIYIFDWAIFNCLFSFIRLIKEINPQAKIFVHFHNVTPAELVSAEMKAVISKSYEQFLLFNYADKIWVTGEFNKLELIDFGISPEKMQLLPPAIQFSDPHPPLVNELICNKQGDITEIVFVGRFVPAKRLEDLVAAIKYLLALNLRNIKLYLVGATVFSNSEYSMALKHEISSSKLEKYIEIIEDASEENLKNIYKRCRVFITATLHEGFCVPIVEALYYGCYVIAYKNSNLPYVIKDHGILVENDSVQALSKALYEVVISFSRSDNLIETKLKFGLEKITYADFIERAVSYAGTFSFSNYSRKLIELLLS